MINIRHEITRATIYFRGDAERRGMVPVSRLFTVVERGGGWRMVVTEFWRIKFHVHDGERAVMVPKVRIAEPVDWHDIPRTVKLAERYAAIVLSRGSLCGECRACCETLYIDFGHGRKKPSHELCKNCSLLTGCTVQHNKPKVCRDFECHWLRSQSRNDVMPPELRPDRCGVIFSDDSDGDPEQFEFHVSRMTPEAQNYIEAEQARGRKAKFVRFYRGEERAP